MNNPKGPSKSELKYHEKQARKRADQASTGPKSGHRTTKRATHNGSKEEGSRNASFKSFDAVVTALKKRGLTDLRDTFEDVLKDMRLNGMSEDEFGASLYDPDLTDLRKLAIGLLFEKEETMPHRFIPRAPDQREKLMKLCRRMIIRNEDPALIAEILKKFPSPGSRSRAGGKLDTHVSELISLSDVDEKLYDAVIAGQLGEVVLALRRNRIPPRMSRERLFGILHRQSLLWCCNDIQMILAHLHVANKNPMLAFIESDYHNLEPETAEKLFDASLRGLQWILEIYRPGAPESDAPKFDDIEDTNVRSGLKILMALVISEKLTDGKDLVALKAELDRVVEEMIADIAAGKTYLIGAKNDLASYLEPDSEQDDETDTANKSETKGRTPDEKSFAQSWFGLSLQQAAMVPILRYVQAEAMLEDHLRYMCESSDAPSDRALPKALDSWALPPIDKEKLNIGWNVRSRRLLFRYRQQLLNDHMLNEVFKRSTSERTLNVVLEKLSSWGTREIGDDHASRGLERRTFYLLDIIPEHRLSLQANMLRKDRSGRPAVFARI